MKPWGTGRRGDAPLWDGKRSAVAEMVGTANFSNDIIEKGHEAGEREEPSASWGLFPLMPCGTSRRRREARPCLFDVRGGIRRSVLQPGSLSPSIEEEHTLACRRGVSSLGPEHREFHPRTPQGSRSCPGLADVLLNKTGKWITCAGVRLADSRDAT